MIQTLRTQTASRGSLPRSRKSIARAPFRLCLRANCRRAPPASGPRQPLVIDEPDRAAHELIWEWVRELDGVAHADLVYIHLEDSDEIPLPIHTD